jgi:(S)-ureidoglycine-glyoxylate aminotransferase
MASQPINPPSRLLMGPGPINADPRVLRAMSAQLLGQYDPAMTAYMTETMGLYREVFRTANEQTLLVDGTSRAGIEAALISMIEPGDRVLVPVFGRFGHLLREIAERSGAEVHVIEAEWGTVFTPEQIERAIRETKPKILAVVHGDTSTTMAQPLDELGAICREHGVIFYTASTPSPRASRNAWPGRADLRPPPSRRALWSSSTRGRASKQASERTATRCSVHPFARTTSTSP